MYEERISLLIASVFYPAYKLKKSTCMKHIEDCLVGLNIFKVILPFSMFKQPKFQKKGLFTDATITNRGYH